MRARIIPIRKAEPDISVTNAGSFFLFYALTDRAEAWIINNCADAQWCGMGAIAVEHRYAEDLANGAKAAGLLVV